MAKMSTELITSILSVVAAVIPLIIVIVTILRNRTEKTNEPLDSPLLNVLVIKRNPVDEKILNKISRNSFFYFPNIKTYIFFFIIYYIMLLYVSNTIIDGTQSITFSIEIKLIIVVYIILFSFGMIVAIYGLRIRRINRRLKVSDIRFLIFKDAELVVEANFLYLFNKCHETLRSMDFNVVEVNKVTSSLEAYRGKGWTKGTDRLKVQIEPVKHSERSYIIRLEFENGKDLPQGSNISYLFIKRLIHNSKVTNGFINRLISKSKRAEQKAESKVDTSTDVGD